MARWKLTIEYDGGPFVGWQRQASGIAVQQRIEEAASQLAGMPTTIYGAGRTDSGVHALGQVAHFDLSKDLRFDQVRDALNFYLKPDPISVIDVTKVDYAFHARFSATGRRYLYRILDRRVPPALDIGRVWNVPVALDVAAMQDAAQGLVGHHDFSSFRSTECQADSPVKTLDMINFRRVAEEIHVDVAALSFLHNQVRILVGTLEKVGRGKWSAKDVLTALEARERSAAGPTAPPDGLYLASVTYP